MEESIVTNRLNAHIDPSLSIWGWEIPVYLFLGGLAAGLLILGAMDVLKNGARRSGGQRLLAAVPLVIGAGMFALFLDLDHKLYVWRFYTAFRVSAPMSWGAWILLLVVPANLLLVLGTLERAWPQASRWLQTRAVRLEGLTRWSERKLPALSWLTIVLGIGLGIYTGILLSAYGARPFWNTSILGILFLVSGLSSAAALVQLGSREHAEKQFYLRADVALILVELVLLGLMVIGMVSGPVPQRDAAALILGGPLTTYFWVFVIGVGLLLPVLLEAMHLRGRPLPRFLAPAFILLGGLIFRFFIVEAGQMTAWLSY